MIPPFRLHAPFLSPQDTEQISWYPRGAMVVNEHGRIAWHGDAENLPGEFLPLPSVHSENIMLPGLVDAHVHYPQLDCRGQYGNSLLEWLDRSIYPEEARFTQAGIARDTARRFFSALLSAGTTTAMVYGTIHEAATDIAFEEAERSGMRIILGKMLMDREAPAALLEPADEGLAATERLIRKWHKKTHRLFYAVSPRFAISCSPSLLQGAAALATRYDTYVQTHCNESIEEVARVMILFPEATHYTDVYARSGLLTSRTVLGHNIHCDDAQLRQLRSHDCAVAHCPDANLFLGSGRFPLEAHQQHGLRIALGSDVGAGTTLSMFHVMHSMSHVQGRSLDPRIPLYHATLGAATALGLQEEIGSFRIGKQADITETCVPRHYCHGRTLEHLSALDVASTIVYRSADLRAGRVWISGEQLNPPPST
ncbi:MAG: guanine deaminase [Bacteroidetes bacterium]|nr:guanine deaminase [Bacteroidota bacterium]